MTKPSDKNADAILRQGVERRITAGEIRPIDRERAVTIAHTLWTGGKGNGQAVDEAARVCRET